MLLFRIKKTQFFSTIKNAYEKTSSGRLPSLTPSTHHGLQPGAERWGQPGEQLQPLPRLRAEHGVRQPLPDQHQQLWGQDFFVLNLEDGLQGGRGQTSGLHVTSASGKVPSFLSGWLLPVLGAQLTLDHPILLLLIYRILSDFLHSIYNSIQNWACFSAPMSTLDLEEGTLSVYCSVPLHKTGLAHCMSYTKHWPETGIWLVFIKKKFFLAKLCSIQDLNSLTRDQTQALSNQSTES